jgi:hypothetical protein
MVPPLPPTSFRSPSFLPEGCFRYQSGLVRSSLSADLCWSGMCATESRAGRKSTSWPILKLRNYLPRKETLQEQQRSPRAHFEQQFQQQIAKITSPVWFLASNEDLRWPTVKLRGANPNPGLRLLRNYLDLVLFSAIIDPEIAMAYSNVHILATPLSSLFRPRMVANIFATATKRAVKRLLGRKEDSGFALSPEVLSSLRARPESSKPVSFIERKV